MHHQRDLNWYKGRLQCSLFPIVLDGTSENGVVIYIRFLIESPLSSMGK